MSDDKKIRDHYNKLGLSSASLRRDQALARRAAGPAAAIKAFHNHVKKQLILAFAGGASSLLDLCCGRGGDLLKWSAAKLKYVKAIDFSEMELQEAQRRYDDLLQGKPGHPGRTPRVEFVHNDDLGRCVFVDVQKAQGYDVVTCMFALHYFFKSPDALRTFLTNVSVNLAPGGHFVGVVPDGRRVCELMLADGSQHSSTRSGLLSLTLPRAPEASPPEAGPFGHKCIFRIQDTVTDLDGQGSEEFLVDEATLIGAAAEFGLRPVSRYPSPPGVRDWDWRSILNIPRHDEPQETLFRALNGRCWYNSSSSMQDDPAAADELHTISSLFCVFAFVKDEAPW